MKLTTEIPIEKLRILITIPEGEAPVAELRGKAIDNVTFQTPLPVALNLKPKLLQAEIDQLTAIATAVYERCQDAIASKVSHNIAVMRSNAPTIKDLGLNADVEMRSEAEGVETETEQPIEEAPE